MDIWSIIYLMLLPSWSFLVLYFPLLIGTAPRAKCRHTQATVLGAYDLGLCRQVLAIMGKDCPCWLRQILMRYEPWISCPSETTRVCSSMHVNVASNLS